MVTTKSIEEMATVLRGLRARRDRLGGYRATSVDIIRALSTGDPVSEGQLLAFGARRGATPAAIDAIKRSAEWRDGSVVGMTGLSLSETRHRLELSQRTLYTWCAWDPLFLVPILGGPATMTSTAPRTGTLITIHLTPTGVEATEPRSTVMSVVLPDSDATPSTAADIRATFCRFVNYFDTAAAAEAWLPTGRGATVLDPQDGFRLGQLVYGDLAAL